MGVAAVIHGVLFWFDFHGYARLVARASKWLVKSWGYSVGEGRYRRIERPGGIRATPGFRRFGGAWAVAVGLLIIILSLTGHLDSGRR